jgi:hypothetical protein
MRVGSLVIFIGREAYTDMITPDPNEVYTVRDLNICVSRQNPNKHLGILLEEIVNGTPISVPESNFEIYYPAHHFIEVQPPMDDMLKELLKEPEKAY